MSFSKSVKYSLALLTITLNLSGLTFKSRPRPLSLTALAESSSTEQGADGIPLPESGKSIARELSTGETHVCLITLDAGQYLHAVVEQQGIDAGVTLYEPGGRMLVQLDCRHYGPTPISLIAETSGVYRLEVRSLEKEQTRGRYELRVTEIRPAMAKDNHRIAAEKTFAEGEQLLKEWIAESNRRAIDKFNDSLSAWRSVGDRREEALTLKRIGDMYHPLGEHKNALTFYNQALSLVRNLKDHSIESEILNQIGYVYLTLGDNQKALKFCAQTLKLSQATDNRRERARALNNLGEISYGSGKLQQSLEFYRQALSLWRESGDRQGQALTLLNVGYTYSDLARTREAFDFYNQALSFWRIVNNPRGQAATLCALGRLFSRMGESQAALDFFERAMQLVRQVGDPIEEARILGGMAYIYDGLGEKQKALEYYDRALSLFRATNYPNGEGSALFDAGRVHLSLGNNQKALEYHQQAISIFKDIGDHRMEIAELKEIGRVYNAWGDKARALKYYLRARSFYHAEKDLRGEAVTLNLIGRVYEERGQGHKALDCYEKALPLSRKAEHRVGESSTLHNIARVERDRGNLSEARARAEDALRVVESLREKVNSQDLRASYFASVRQQHEFYVDLLMRLHRERPSEGFEVAAFEASERARARSLMETLAAARVGDRRRADPALLEREGSLRKELNERAERRMRLRAGSGQALAEESALGKEMDELTSQLREVEAQVRAGSIEHTASLETQPLGLRAIQERVVDDDTLLLEYSLGEERSYLWAVTKTEALSYELPGRAEIEGAAQRVRALLTAPQPIEGETFAMRQERVKEAEGRYWREAAALGEMLLGQVAERLGEKRLLVVADGALQYIPFGALPAPRRGEGEPVPLMLEHEITSQPSASTLAALRGDAGQRRSGPRGVAVFADPVFERDDARLTGAGGEIVAEAQTGPREGDAHRALRDVGVMGGGGNIPRLFASREEAKAIRDVTPAGANFEAIGFEANRDAASSPELAKYRIIHFATHGALDSERPELSGLVLSLFDEHGRPREGFLRLNDIYNLDLPAELVVLSACNTGLGKDVKGEGLIGLTRGFMHAGAARVLASLWKVDDEATAELMKTFYGEMLREKKSPAAALRAAQSAMWRQKRWRAPYFWAAFVLQGEYSGKIEVGEDAPLISQRQTGAAGAAMLALVLGGGYLLRRKRRNRSPHVH